MNDIQPVLAFLHCATPKAWIDSAVDNLPILIIDHANCEKKAASTALNLMYRYVDRFDLLNKMSRLAREELRHFEQVLRIMKRRGIEYESVSASGYAAGLHKHIRKAEPDRLIDTLIVGAVIEARSCERFYCLIDHVDDELSGFYQSLLKSESRHFQDYLLLAERVSDFAIASRVEFFLEKDAALINEKGTELRFHSGVPV